MCLCCIFTYKSVWADSKVVNMADVAYIPSLIPWSRLYLFYIYINAWIYSTAAGQLLVHLKVTIKQDNPIHRNISV